MLCVSLSCQLAELKFQCDTTGDSVGAGLEFKSREWIEEHVDFTDYVSTGDGMWAEGTDDTEMTVGLVCVPS